MVSPGVPADHPALAGCRARGVPVIGELELAYRTMTAEFVAITGHQRQDHHDGADRSALWRVRPAVLVGGNIGRPLAADALTFPADGWVVAEVSSFQLETTDAFRPHVAAVLNVTPDHLDRHGSLAAYADAKARIFHAQTAGGLGVLNADDPGRRRAGLARGARSCGSAGGSRSRGSVGPRRLGHAAPRRRRRRRSARRRDLPARRPQPRERAGRDGVRAARSAWRPSALRAAIRAFRAVPHRIEWVRDSGGVAFYNDSKGTNVDATLKALAAFGEPIVLIAGAATRARASTRWRPRRGGG